MERPTTRLRRLLKRPGLLYVPVVFDPLGAKIAAESGFECVALGGYALGAHLGVGEPLLTLSEVAEATRRIAAVGIPVVVDADAGFGEPLHTVRTVRELELAGAVALHIEDQVFPKRAHYHRDYREHTVPAEEMVRKLEFARRARRDPDLVIIARTDAMRTHGYAEGVRRANLYAEAGADLVMLFPNDADEAARAPRDCRVPLVYVNSAGNRVGRPVLSRRELEGMGYKVAVEAIAPLLGVYRELKGMFMRLKAEGISGLAPAEAIRLRKELEDTLGLEEYYRIEEETVERP